MKRFLFLFACLCVFTEIVSAQTIYMNVPDTVCMSTNNGTSDQVKFTSINAYLATGQTGPTVWTIQTPGGTNVDYSILYSSSTSTDKTARLSSNALTLQFLNPGTYTLTAAMTYSNGTVYRKTVTLVALDCTMPTCNGGNAVMPGFSEDFGTLASNAGKKEYSPSSAVAYTYDGSGTVGMAANNYAISYTTHWANDWITSNDHTGSNRGGMLIANADGDPRIFYSKSISSLCKNSVYNFSAWLINLDSATAFNQNCPDYKYPGVTFQILNAADTSQVLGQYKTYAISSNLAGRQWQRYGGTFTVPSTVSDVVVRIKNNAPGGCGNNIGIDDIEFTFCSPVISAAIEGNAQTLKEVLCQGAPTILTSSFTPASYYAHAEYQWEMSDDGGVTWFNVPYGTANKDTLVIAQGELVGTKTAAADYYFRVRLYESGSSAETCAAPSAPVKLTILPMPQLSLTKSQVCAGTTVDLQASGGFDKFEWSDTLNYYEPNRSIKLIRDTTIKVYGLVFYGDDKFCKDSNSTSIKVDDEPLVQIGSSQTSLCVGNRISMFVNDVLSTTADSILWYRGVPGSGQLMPEFTGMTIVNYNPETLTDNQFYVRVKQTTCEVTSDVFTFTLTDVPVPDPGTSQYSCATDNPGGTFKLNRTLATGTKGSWQTIGLEGPGISGATGNINFDDYVIYNHNNPKAVVTMNTAGTTAYLQWKVQSSVNGSCVVYAYDTLTYMGEATRAYVDSAMTQCGTSNVFTMRANEPNTELTGEFVETGKWKLLSGTATIADTTAYNTQVTIPQGNYQDVQLQWCISNKAACGTSYDTVTIHYKDIPKATLTPVTVCAAAGTFDLNPAAISGDPAYYAITSTMTGFTAVPTTPITTWPVAVSFPTTTAAGTYNFELTLSNDSLGCTNTIPFTLNVQSGSVDPTGVTVGSPLICQTGTTTLTVEGGSLAKNADGTDAASWVWYAGGCGTGTAIGTGATITVPVTATTTYYVRAEGAAACAGSNCASGIVTVSDKPTDADAGADANHCSDSVFVMAANVPSLATAKGVWSISSGTARITDTTSATTTVYIKPGVTAVLTWTITNGACTSADNVTLANFALSGTANAGVDTMSQCNNPKFVMAATGTGTWSFLPGSKATIDIANSATATITLPAGDTATAIWNATNGLCTSTDSIFLRNLAMPENAVAGAAQTHCNDSLFHMAAATSTYMGTWTVISGAAVIADKHSATSDVIVKVNTTATLQWVLSNGSCTGNPATVTLNNIGGVLGNTISADQVLCATETPASLKGTGTVSGGDGTYAYQWQMSTTNAITGFYNVTTGAGGTTATYTPAAITADTVWLRRVVTSGCSGSSLSNVVKLQRISAPPVVIAVPPSKNAACSPGTDFTTLFGSPVFSHAPYTNEALTVTYADNISTPDGCTTILMRTWTARDRCGLTASAQQTITVKDTTGPVFTTAAPANITVGCDNIPPAVSLAANDLCSGSMVVPPLVQRVDMPGTCRNNYYLIRKWVAVDNCGNASDTLKQIVTVKDTTGPVFNVTQPANITVDCDKLPPAVNLTATDNCTAGIITAIPVDTRQNVSGSSCVNTYQITRTWTASDSCGNTSVLKQIITVVDTTKPVFSVTLRDTTVNCDQVPSLDEVTATDNCTANVKVTLSETKAFLNTSCTNSYRLTRTFTATDGCGNKATMKQVITVQDTTRPVFTVNPPGDITVDCDAIPATPTTVNATDNCGTVKVSFSQSRVAAAGACAGNYQLIRTWIAKDQCGNTNTWKQTITVQDTTKPVIGTAPADVTVACGGTIPAEAALYATDNCDAAFPKRATMTTDPYTVDICNGYTITRRWNIKDACGNAATEKVQVIKVIACPKPQLDTALPVNCSDNPKFALQLKNKVSKPKFTLQSVYPASAVTAPLTQSSNVFNLNGAVQATFVVTDGVTGCVSDPVTYNLRYVNKPVLNLGKDTGICKGNSLTLDIGVDNASAGYDVKWSTGASTQQITVSAAGTYSATVTNNGCSATDEIKVTVHEPPVVAIEDATICEGNTVKLNAYVQGASYLWSTGDTGPSIIVSTTGTYNVEVSLNGCTVGDNATVTVAAAPNVTLTPDVAICTGERTTLEVEPDGGTVVWSDGSTVNTISVSKPGDYWVTVTKNSCVVKDTVSVTSKGNIGLNLGIDKEICAGGSVMLNATNEGAISYLWNDGSTDPVREVKTPGTYIVKAMDKYCSQTTSDTINVTVAGLQAFSLGKDTTICEGEVLTLNVSAGTGNSVKWQDGASTSWYVVTKAGYYTATIYNDCGGMTAGLTVNYKTCNQTTGVVNAFTPNGDGNNDYFRPGVLGAMIDYELSVYNRWGVTVYSSKEVGSGWDGRFKGALVDEGTYLYIVNYRKAVGGPKLTLKGNVTVIK
ncbi:gliding motility-associated C-terminal domain-containing protein [Chitinophaga sancti]|uniref:Gliding motility-associated C-terminal domain-containing protein n=1 Tax=Chitinophaga sancti TaxID=1004 RepID=A0A1K1S3L6_9BACT|nr:gliding motility-associated C-terminal domain-containing protein [Chitinophaga sancti]WQD63778.1 gliding motility-associated C-terminal domain-containing protein [Chitinophaga sancti]WQG90597.1 gliding motility-associated C-terminal domain-containing protein [Chitinophaga sancti]SFW78902.1 gliding motility-associated C-terminal domain-containing protein [Chitinophaga sancti]